MVASSTSFSPLLPQSESELASSGLILVDSLASANNLSLADLNAAPESHQEALDQLKIAKKYIRCVQAQSRTGGYGTKLGLGHVSSDLEDQTTLTVAAQQRSDETDEAAAPGHSAEMTPYTYFHTPWWRLLLKRLPWLISLLLLQSFGALILDSYNKLISKHLVLNFFIPMMQGTSGNAGNQPGVMVTRALGLGQLHLPSLILKEGPVAILTAATLGVVAYLRIRLVYDDPGSAMSIALAMFVSIILAVTLSISFSYVLHRITCCDPADGAVPLLSTVSDVLSILVLMSIAEKILPKAIDQ